VTVSGGDVFVLNRAGSVTEVSATNGSLVRVIHGQRFGFARPVAMVAHAGRIWVANRRSGAITELSASDGSLVRVVTAAAHPTRLDHPVAITAAPGHIWVLNSTGASSQDPNAGSATELSSATGAFIRNVHAKTDGIETPRGIAFDGTHVWITDSTPGTLTELSADGSLVQIVTDSSAGNVYLEYGTVVVAHKGNIYVISPPGSSPMVSRIVAKTVTGKWYECNTNTPDPNFVNPTGLAAQGHHVWVVSPNNNTLAELHVSTGLLIHDFS
jgi:sugar lactone lactonase YvrE